VQQVAAVETTVLLTGETGTGKELIARALHQGSPRRDRPLIKVNCGAIPQGVVESELSGTRRAPSPARCSGGSGGSNWPTRARCSWMK
jgi:transcriptional regulator with GAF, ATPase, and Fis domain